MFSNWPIQVATKIQLFPKRSPEISASHFMRSCNLLTRFKFLHFVLCLREKAATPLAWLAELEEKYDGNVNAKNENGHPVIAQATAAGNLEYVMYLVQHGADIEVRNPSSWTALLLAAYYDKIEIVEYLVGRGADVKATNKYDRTALHGASWY